MTDRSVSVPMTLSDLEGGTRWAKFYQWISLSTSDQIRLGNTCGDGLIDQPRPHSKRRGAGVPKMFGIRPDGMTNGNQILHGDQNR